MSTTVPETPTIPEPAEREPAALFRYSTWVHVGVGAEDCEEVDENEGTNGCGDRSHFHAWCRLPNPLQQAEIRDRALAAKARKIRQLHDPEADAYAVIDEEFGAFARQGDLARSRLIEDLLSVDYWQDYYRAMMDVRQLDDPHDTSDEEPAKRFAHIADDQARFRRLEATPEDQRPADEHEELGRHIAAYQEALEQAMEDIQGPKRKALEALGTEQLVAQLRDKRIDAEASREFQRTFEVHEWLSCTYREQDGPPALASLEVLERAAGEIVAGLQATFADLHRSANEAQGNW